MRRANCSDGHRYNFRSGTCELCRQGFYRTQGECDSGWELDETTGNCVLCRRGFYKDKAQHFYCQRCPVHLLTPGTGSTVSSDCNQGNCTAGYMIVGKTCRECPVGTYQDKRWQTECIPCGNQMATGRKGATSSEECI
ncbi:hypothetical protein NP493_384g01021 [Ridgeia piscesae]|uniref:Tyrosine-protein kinase ephrin type A/B receptor-like domain-containing protein n=1 Tax=Ridgeia piscesae TaxID=27915 RepID=A0AAD9NV02_RIDPI|nr:hypothetical protein NP493_384g01021 [Ridgeia piscesae]